VFIFLSRVLDVLVDPLSWALLLGALALLSRRRGPGVAAVVVLWAFSTELVSAGIGWLVEGDARDTSRPGVVYDAVIVLGGAGDVVGRGAEARLELNPAADRLVAANDVLRSGRARLAILAGGEQESDVSEGEATARLLAAWGIDRDRLLVEGSSRNTRENAIETARIVRERGLTKLLLVTSAAHMPRAAGCFRAVGLEPDTLPVDRRAKLGIRRLGRVLPRAYALDRSADFLRELAGRIVYRAVGYAR
jgi:uncharacterized SAM-binding protein YcdF (DUF218 family)